MNSSEPIYLYTDGGSVGNPGPGGYGLVIRDGDDVIERSQGFRLTTNNRMELKGVLAGLAFTADSGRNRSTVVSSDSRYVVNAVENGWLERWAANGWKTKSGRIKNIDLWKQMLTYLEDREVEFRWVKGHSGHPENERCDELVQQASRGNRADLEVDSGYEVSTSSSKSAGSSLFSESEGRGTKSQVVPVPEFNHLDSAGNAAMVDVSPKASTARRAVARCSVVMSPVTLQAVVSGNVAKGDVMSVARTAGIMAAKRTSELIPLCHQIPLGHLQIDIHELADGTGLSIEASALAEAKTGVEMEALTAASVAALTVYDMCKSAERGIRITDLRLVSKSGGIHGDYSSD